MPVFSRPNFREILWITLSLAIVCIVISVAQYGFLVWKMQHGDAHDLEVDAEHIAAKLLPSGAVDLRSFNKAYVDAGPYTVISGDGTVIDISAGNKDRTPSFLPAVHLPWLDPKRLDQVQSYTSQLGEHFKLVTVQLEHGYGVVGLSEFDDASNPDQILLRNAGYFPRAGNAAKTFRVDAIDNQVNWALVGDDWKLIAADGRLPFRVDPLILGQQSTAPGMKHESDGTSYYVRYSTLKNGSGGVVAEVIGYQDVTGELALLEDVGNFSLVVAALSFFLFLSLFIISLVRHEAEKHELRTAFQRYFSPQIMEAILREPHRLKEQRREVTVMFSDIRSFTSMAERLPAEKLSRILQEYFHEMTEEVIASEGVVDKFIGDGIMAFWGAPIDQPDQADRAVTAAKGMVKRLEKLKSKWAEEGGSVLEIGIAVNFGVATVGNFGSKHRVDYTVIGDVVNVASRLEGLNKELKSHIIISEATRRQLSGSTETRDLGRVQIRGHEETIHVHEVLVKG